MNKTTYEYWAWVRLTALVNEGHGELRQLRNLFADMARKGEMFNEDQRESAESAIYAR